MPEVVNIERDPETRPDEEIRTVSFVSLGCPKNTVDSEKMLGLLAQQEPGSHESYLGAIEALLTPSSRRIKKWISDNIVF